MLIIFIGCGQACNYQNPFDKKHSSLLKLEKVRLGTGLAMNGEIKDADLQFYFPSYREGGTAKDLFNYLYFKGDTVCFSFSLSKAIGEEKVSVYFKNPKNNEYFKAERTDIYKNRIFGFSLVGTLMEQFFGKYLKYPVPSHRWCCREIPFEVILDISGGKSLKASTQGAFIIYYKGTIKQNI